MADGTTCASSQRAKSAPRRMADRKRCDRADFSENAKSSAKTKNNRWKKTCPDSQGALNLHHGKWQTEKDLYAKSSPRKMADGKRRVRVSQRALNLHHEEWQMEKDVNQVPRQSCILTQKPNGRRTKDVTMSRFLSQRALNFHQE